MAEVLGLPSVTFAKSVAVEDGVLKVNRQTEAGYDEVTCPLPAVVSVTAGVVEPRYPSFKGIMAAKSKPVDTVTAADLGVAPVGWAGAGQQIVDVADAPERAVRARSSRTTVRPTPRSSSSSPGSRSSEKADEMTCRQHLGVRPGAEGAPTSTTLELLTKARQLGVDGDGVRRRRCRRARRALGDYGATKVYATGDLQGALPASPSPRR